MYEPKYPPRLNVELPPLPKLRYGITNPVGQVRPEDPESEPLHIHGCYEIFFNVAGEVSFFLNNRLYPVHPGEAVLSYPNQPHVCIYDQAGYQEHFCLWLEWDAEEAPYDLWNRRDRSPLFNFGEDAVQVERLFRRLYAMSRQKAGDSLRQNLCLHELFQLFSNTEQSEPQSREIPRSLQEILDGIESRVTDFHHVKDLSEHYFVSPATLSRWFRKYLHTSPREFLESKRLSLAANLLSKGMTVTEACMQSGFSDCSHFIVMFKRRFGMTPLAYKRRGE